MKNPGKVHGVRLNAVSEMQWNTVATLKAGDQNTDEISNDIFIWMVFQILSIRKPFGWWIDFTEPKQSSQRA